MDENIEALTELLKQARESLEHYKTLVAQLKMELAEALRN